jgi:hypothetical protein
MGLSRPGVIHPKVRHRVVFGLSSFPSRKENGLISSRFLRENGRWPYQVRNGYFYLYDEDEQRVLTDSGLVFSVKPRKALAFAIGRSQTRYQF